MTDQQLQRNDGDILQCTHCLEEIEQFVTPERTYWAHKIGEGSYLNRCRAEGVPYGMEAHPVGIPCPMWCLGYELVEGE